MREDKEDARRTARELAGEFIKRGDATGWFEPLYRMAAGDARNISWADMGVSSNFSQWVQRYSLNGTGKRAIDIGCGLGDNAEELSRLGFDVVAFDVSRTAIEWCRQRFPGSSVEYCSADLFALPESWIGAFDFALEMYTLQVLPVKPRQLAMEQIASLIAPGGTLLVISRGRSDNDQPGKMPWPLTRKDLRHFEQAGLREGTLEDYVDDEDPPVRRFRAEYCGVDSRPRNE